MGMMTPPGVTDLAREVDGGVSERDRRGSCEGNTSHDQDSAVIMMMDRSKTIIRPSKVYVSGKFWIDAEVPR